MDSVVAAEGYRSMRRQALPPNRATGLRPHKGLHDAHHGRLRGRPCRASLCGGLPNPGFGCPCRATHPGLWGGIAPIGACSAVGVRAVVGTQDLGRDRPYRGLLGRWGKPGAATPKPCGGDPQSCSCRSAALFQNRLFAAARPFPITRSFYPV